MTFGGNPALYSDTTPFGTYQALPAGTGARSSAPIPIDQLRTRFHERTATAEDRS